MKKLLAICQVLLLSACGSTAPAPTLPPVAPGAAPSTNAAPASVGPITPPTNAPTGVVGIPAVPSSNLPTNSVFIISDEEGDIVTGFNSNGSYDVLMHGGTIQTNQTLAQVQALMLP